jgi:hypothetical protein
MDQRRLGVFRRLALVFNPNGSRPRLSESVNQHFANKTLSKILLMLSILWGRLNIWKQFKLFSTKGSYTHTDQAARRRKRNRSALVRDALREHLQRLELRAKEERDREGYVKHPHRSVESASWEAEAVWPAE